MSSTGFDLHANGLSIKKDPEAILSYAFDWSDWLLGTDTISTVVYSVQARLNDPDPVIIVSSGHTTTQTYVEVSGGQVNKSYLVTAKITTANGLIDRRNFTIRVENRSA